MGIVMCMVKYTTIEVMQDLREPSQHLLTVVISLAQGSTLTLRESITGNIYLDAENSTWLR